MEPPKPGELRHALRFERRINGGNVGGVVKYDWEALDGLDDIRAKVTPRLGGDEVIAGRVAGKVQYNVEIRSSQATRCLKNTDRAINTRTGEVYNLGQPIDPYKIQRRWLLIDATSPGDARGEGER